MTSSNADWKLGETRGPIKVWITAEAQNAIAAGDVVMTATQNEASYDGNVKVWKHTGGVSGNEAFGVALYNAATGENVQILLMGVVKVTFKTAIGHDGPIAADGAQIAPGAATAHNCGWLISGGKAAGDTGVILFWNTTGSVSVVS